MCIRDSAKGESGGTGDGDRDMGSPRELREDPLGCLRRLLKCFNVRNDVFLKLICPWRECLF